MSTIGRDWIEHTRQSVFFQPDFDVTVSVPPKVFAVSTASRHPIIANVARKSGNQLTPTPMKDTAVFKTLFREKKARYVESSG